MSRFSHQKLLRNILTFYTKSSFMFHLGNKGKTFSSKQTLTHTTPDNINPLWTMLGTMYDSFMYRNRSFLRAGPKSFVTICYGK